MLMLTSSKNLISDFRNNWKRESNSFHIKMVHCCPVWGVLSTGSSAESFESLLPGDVSLGVVWGKPVIWTHRL